MRRHTTLGVVLLLSGVVQLQAFTPAVSDFAWRQDITNDLRTAELYRIRLPGEVFDGCRNFPDDLRVFTHNGTAVPHWIRRPAPRLKDVERKIEILNRVWMEEGPCQRLDLWLHRVSSRPVPRHNLVRITTSGREFLRRVEVYGREPDAPWGLLGRGWIFLEAGHATHHNDHIEYPDSTLPELRIRVFADVRNADERFEVRDVSLFFRETQGGEEEPVGLSLVPARNSPRKKGIQTLVLDTGFQNRPIDSLEIDSDTPDYVRRITVEGRNDDEWFDIGAGVVQRFDEIHRNRIELNGRPVRQVRVRIFNHDDPPLANPVVSGRAVPHDLLFEPPENGPAALYFGSELVQMPRYDLRARSRNRAQEAKPTKLAQRLPNEAYKARGFGATGPWLATLAVAVVSGLVLWAIADMLKHHPRSHPAP